MREQDDAEGGAGDEISDDEIAQRAQEIARSRGREEPAEADWATALTRLGVLKKKPGAPELE